jgi:hypothetical protein
MDRSELVFNRQCYDRWQTDLKIAHACRLQEIQQSPPKHVPSQRQQQKDYAAMKNIYEMPSRKQQLIEDRKRQIDRDNQELYNRMTSIFKNGAGHVAPLKRPGYSTYYGGFDFHGVGSSHQKSRQSGWGSESGDGDSPGRDLVMNRKSLNVESVRQTNNKIRDENLKFLAKL